MNNNLNFKNVEKLKSQDKINNNLGSKNGEKLNS